MGSYHVYQDSWDAAMGEQLPCKREPENCYDSFVEPVVRSHVTVPKQSQRIWQFRIRVHLKISVEGHLDLRIKCEVVS